MKIKEGDIFPNVDTFQVSENGPEAVSTKKLLEKLPSTRVWQNFHGSI